MIKPINKKVLIKPDKAKEVSDGGILLAPQAQERPRTGKVIETANNCEQIQKGQKIMFGRYSGTPIEENNEKYILMNEKDILLIIEQAE